MNFNISITKEDLREIESKYEKLTNFLTNNLTSWPACAFVLQSIMDAVEKTKEQLREKTNEKTARNS